MVRIEDVLILFYEFHCLAMPAFQEVEGQPFIQDFILKSDRRGEGLMFHHGGVVTYSSSNVLETLSLLHQLHINI